MPAICPEAVIKIPFRPAYMPMHLIHANVMLRYRFPAGSAIYPFLVSIWQPRAAPAAPPELIYPDGTVFLKIHFLINSQAAGLWQYPPLLPKQNVKMDLDDKRHSDPSS